MGRTHDRVMEWFCAAVITLAVLYVGGHLIAWLGR